MAEDTNPVAKRSGQAKQTTKTKRTAKTRGKRAKGESVCGKIAKVLKSPEFAVGVGVVATILGGLSRGGRK